MESPFLQQVLHEPWKLSTSQVYLLLIVKRKQSFLQTSTTYDDKRLESLIKKNPDLALKYELSNQRNLASGGGGFGPVRFPGT